MKRTKPKRTLQLQSHTMATKASPDQIADFLESYRMMMAEKDLVGSKAISLRVPLALLNAFRKKAELEGVAYQSQIKKLMEQWVHSGKTTEE